MAGLDVTALTIQIKSEGIDAAVRSLNSLAEASDRVDSSTTTLTNSAQRVNSAYAESRAAADKLLATYQKQVDLLGANVSQTNAYNVSLKGGTAAQQAMAQSLGAQVDAYKRLTQDQAEAIRMNKAMEQSTKDSKSAADSFLKSLQDQAGAAGLSGKALREYNAELLRTKAAQLGVSEQAGGFIQKLQDTEKASAHAGGGLSGITRELIVLGHEASQGQFTRFGGSLIVLGERMDVGGKLARWLSAGIAEAGGSVLAFLAPIAALAAAIGVVVAGFLTWFHSIQALHEFNKELILTGGYAGASANEFYTMADAVGKANGNIGAARESAQKLVATGKFTSEQINEITKASVGLYTYGGVAIDKTIAQFEKLAKEPLTGTEQSYRQVSKAALELDQSMHFLEPTVMKAIIDAEKLGDLHQASSIATHALAEEEMKRAKELEENLTTLGHIAHDTGAAFTNMWNNLWTKESPQQRLSGLVAQLKALPTAVEANKGVYGGAANDETRRSILKQMALEQSKILAERQAAEEKQAKAEENTNANLAGNYFRLMDDKKKGDDRYTQAKLAYDRQLENSAGTVFERSKEQQESDLAYLKKTYAEKVKVRAEGTSAIDAELRAIVAASEEQKKALQSDVSALDSAYKAKKISVFDYVDQKAEKLKAEQALTTETYAKEVTALLLSENQANRTQHELDTLAGKRSDLYKKWQDDLSKQNTAMTENGNLISDIASKTADAQATTDSKVIESLKTSIAAVQAKVDAYNRLPESVRKAGVTEKQIQDNITQSYINNMQAEVAQLIENNNVEDPLIKARLELLRQEISLKERLKDTQIAEETIQATNKAIQEYSTAWKQANKQIGDDLASAIVDGGGKGWKKLLKDMELAFAKMILRPILEPISSSFASLVTQVGASSPGAVGGSATGGVNSAVSLASAAANVYKAISGGFTSLSNTVASGVQYVQNTLGSSFGGTGAGAGNATGAFANSVGTAAGYAGGVAAGHVIGNAIAGQYSVAHGQAITNIASVAGAVIAGPIGAAIGGAIGGLFNRAFGMGSKNTTSQGISGNISDSGVTGQAYSNWHQDGGWFRSDKNGTDNTALGADVTNSFASALTSLKSSSTDFAKNINVSADALTNYSKTFDITLTSDTAKNQQAITDFFTTMGDDMATKLVPNIADFSKTGETASGTLQRLSETFSATNAIMNLFGADTSKVFGGLGLESAKARQYLIDLAGGISNLNTQVSFYATNLLTDAEKIAPVQKAVTTALSEMGLSGISTVEQFRNVVKWLDLTTEAGARQFESLMQLAPAFKQVVDATEAATKAAQEQANAEVKAQIDLLNSQLSMRLTIAQLTGDTAAQTAIIAQQRAIEIAGLDATLQPLQSRINALNDEAAATDAVNKANADKLTNLRASANSDFSVLSKSISKAREDAKAAYDAQVAILNAQISSLTNISGNINALSSALDSALNTMLDNTQLAMTRATAQSLLDQAISSARGGKLPSADSLKDVLSTLGKDSSSGFSSYIEYAKDLGITAGKVADLNSITKEQKTIVEQQLDTAKEQLAQSKVSYDAEIAKYDLILNLAQQQLDAMNGTQIAVKELSAALMAFNMSSGAAINQGVSTGAIATPQAATTGQITGLYQSLLGRSPDAQGLAYYQDLSSKGYTASQMAQYFLQSPEYQAIHPNGSHASGLDNVPFDGYTAKLHKGEMVLPAKQAQGVLQGSDMEAVVKKLEELIENTGIENRAIKTELTTMRKIMVNVTPTNDRIQVHEVGAN